MGKKPQVLAGLFLILTSIFIGPLGIIASLTGVFFQSLLLQSIYLLSWMTALFFFKKLLNRKYKHKSSDKYLYLLIVFMFFGYLTNLFSQEIMANEFFSMLTFLLLITYPISVLVFYISCLRIKDIWIKFFSSVGIFSGLLRLFQLGVRSSLMSMKSLEIYLDVFVVGIIVSEAILSYLGMANGILLGGILVVEGLSKKSKKK